MGTAELSQRQKAAIIVRLLLEEDDGVSLDRLPADAQTLLAEEMAGMELIDRHTRDAVIEEFCEDLEAVGLTFPGDLDGTLAMLGGKISADSSDRLRQAAAVEGKADAWTRIAALPQEQLVTLARGEPPELVAVMLSKLPVDLASAAFVGLPRERARAVAQAMSMTAGINHAALRRIGMVLLQAAEALPRPALPAPAADRVGAILNFASADLRDEVLGALDEHDQDFAEGVRRAIFIFAHIPTRVEPRDVPRILREIEQPILIRALSATAEADAEAAQYLLSNLSQRMADGLREELAAMAKPRAKDVEEAMVEVVAAIRRLHDNGEITLRMPSDEG
ncbi:FliG C-terminal domain-containing protein [Paracoccus tibetensis]|uniref:Flagellar motor switch protein FliG n=1 Tax=Paracoccus tibetensis TaxID=336292 RepID=A0A1G5C2S7_9RHOB|nr:FliG C-terminal domain-containing protein [Paracoccus tibetensis]SCX96713.1 flagellar motor switch protein FliG [Paracoccus tibetensis]